MRAANPDSTQLPSVLVLDDEEVQRMTVRFLLEGVADCVEFGEPRPALDYILRQRVDAAIVDLRMPGVPEDGVWFLRELRKRDRELGVVIRTADSSVETAQVGIESRAVQRVVKSEPDSSRRLKDAVQVAIRETKERRRVVAAAADADRSRGELLNVLGRANDEVTVGEVCRGFVLGLADQVIAAAGFTEMLLKHPALTDLELRQIAEQTRASMKDLADSFSDFVRTPFVEPWNLGSGVNQLLGALERLFETHRLFGPDGRALRCSRISPDLAYSANPRRIVCALRHLVEYCALNAVDAGPILLGAAECGNSEAAILSDRCEYVANGKWASNRPTVRLSIEAGIGSPSQAILSRDFMMSSSDPLFGNLLIVCAELIEDKIPLAIVNTPDGRTRFSLFLPVPE